MQEILTRGLVLAGFVMGWGCLRSGFEESDPLSQPVAVYTTAADDFTWARPILLEPPGLGDATPLLGQTGVFGTFDAFHDGFFAAGWLRSASGAWEFGARVGDPDASRTITFDGVEPYPFGAGMAFFDSGAALLTAFAVIPTGMRFSVYRDGVFSTAEAVPDTPAPKVCWLEMDTSPDRGEVALAYGLEDGRMAFALYRDGWVSDAAVTMGPRLRSPDVQGFDLAYERSSGDLLIVWGDEGTPGLRYVTKAAGADTLAPIADLDVGGQAWGAVSLAAAPGSDRIAVVALESAGAVLGGLWDGDDFDGNVLDAGTIDFAGASERRLAGVGWIADDVALATFPEPTRLSSVVYEGGRWQQPVPVPLGLTEVAAVGLWTDPRSHQHVALASGDGGTLACASGTRGAWSLVPGDVASGVLAATVRLNRRPFP